MKNPDFLWEYNGKIFVSLQGLNLLDYAEVYAIRADK